MDFEAKLDTLLSSGLLESELTPDLLQAAVRAKNVAAVMIIGSKLVQNGVSLLESPWVKAFRLGLESVSITEAFLELEPNLLQFQFRRAQNALLISVQQGYVETGRMLIQRGSGLGPHLNLSTIVIQAVEYGQIEMVEALVAMNPRWLLYHDGRKILHQTIKYCHPRSKVAPMVDTIWKLLCHHFPDFSSIMIDGLNCDDSTPLHLAAVWADVATIKILIAAGTKAFTIRDKMNETPYHCAARNGNVYTLRALIENCRPECSLGDLVVGAVWGRKIDSVRYLMSLNAPLVGTRDSLVGTRDWQAIHSTTISDISTISLDMLTSLGFPVDIPGTELPIDLAIDRCKWDSMKFLRGLGQVPTRTVGYFGTPIPEEYRRALTEDEILEIRFRAYFERSLLWRLIFVMGP